MVGSKASQELAGEGMVWVFMGMSGGDKQISEVAVGRDSHAVTHHAIPLNVNPNGLGVVK